MACGDPESVGGCRDRHCPLLLLAEGARKANLQKKARRTPLQGCKETISYFPERCRGISMVIRLRPEAVILTAAAQLSALVTYLFIDTLLLGRSSFWCSPRMSAAPVCVVLGRQQATCSHCLALSSEGRLMPSSYPSEGWRSGPMPPAVVLQT